MHPRLDFSYIKMALQQGFPSFRENGFTARILDPDNKSDLRLFRDFRYRYWVDVFKYIHKPALGISDDQRQEYDKYDEHSVHFGALNQQNKLVGYSRLILPGKHGLQVFNEFEDLVHPRLPESDHMVKSVESSRLITVPELGPKRHIVAGMIYKIQYQFFKRFGFKYWYNTSEITLIRALRTRSYPFMIIGDGKQYQGAVCYPAFMSLEELDCIMYRVEPAHYEWMNEGIEDLPYHRDWCSHVPLFTPEMLEKRRKKRGRLLSTRKRQ